MPEIPDPISWLKEACTKAVQEVRNVWDSIGMLVSRTNYLEGGIASTNSNILSARNKITDLESRMHQVEQRAARLEAHVWYLQYKDIIGRIRWLEGVVFDAGLDTEGNWARYYEDYDHEANWDAWIDNEV